MAAGQLIGRDHKEATVTFHQRQSFLSRMPLVARQRGEMFDAPEMGQTIGTDRRAEAGGFTTYERQDPPAIDVIVRWTLRLALPLVAALAGLVLYWIWFDAGTGNWLQIVGTLPLVVNLVLVTIWAACTWV